MQDVDPHEPLAAALRDHFESGDAVEVRCVRGEGFTYELSTEAFFSLEGPLEREAMAAARGRVLDVGAGAGRHALALQRAGHEVVALDVAPGCVALMRERGVEHAVRRDAFSLDEAFAAEHDRFDTVLLLMQSIGIAGTRFGVEVLLAKLAPCLAVGGQLLLDSCAIDPEAGPASGEVEVHFEYRDLCGAPFSWIYLDESMLASAAAECGLACEVVAREASGDYLARLVRAAPA